MTLPSRHQSREPRRARVLPGPAIAAAFVSALGLSVLAQAAPTFTADPTYKKMVANGRGIRSSLADIEVHTKVKSFPPMSLTFRGHAYFEAPDKQGVVFENVPGMMKGMVKDSPSLAPPAAWPRRYSVTIDPPAGGTKVFHLTSLAEDDPIASADLTVSISTGLVQHSELINRNGSTSSNDLTYVRAGSHMVVATQSGNASGKGYKAEVTSTFSNYRFNVPVSEYETQQ